MSLTDFLNLVLAVLTVLVAVTCSVAMNRLLRPIRLIWRRISTHRACCIGLVGVLVLLVQFLICRKFGPPAPTVHDEFAYLLTADTFLHGRLTNPPPPLVEHFRVPHVIFEPTYQAKYPPAQALTLAAGQLLFSEPIYGVWLTLALAAAATTWMLYQWLPPQWALFGGSLIVLNAPLHMLWGYSYMGGGAAMLGGALLFGGLRRVLAHYHTRDALLMGLGLAILANSRPYEGFLVSLPAAVALFAGLIGPHRPTFARAIFGVIVPLVATVGATAVFIAVYNQAVTGDPFKLPYLAWVESQRANLTTRALFSNSFAKGSIPWRDIQGKLYNQFAFYGQYLISIPLLCVPWICRKRWTTFAVCSAGIVSLAVALQNTAGHLHYAAPATCLVYVVLAESVRRINAWHAGHREFGRVMAGLLPASFAIVGFAVINTYVGGHPMMFHWSWAHQREDIAASLARMPGKHLVIVRYGPKHNFHHEWAYNGADLDSAKIVWAKELANGQNEELIKHFSNRTAWLIEPNRDRVHVFPYLPSTASSRQPDGEKTLSGDPIIPKSKTDG